jgi:hypothetical protein
MAYSTAKGYTVWFLKIPNAIITVNGAQSKGWLQKANNGGTMFFTRADSIKSETYDVVFAPDGNAKF